jgi:hypothetical protein
MALAEALLGVQTSSSIAASRTAGIGASRPMWRIPANVSFLNA